MAHNSPEGLWSTSDGMEMSAILQLERELADFEPVISGAYEIGVQAATIPANRHGEPDIRAAALFLKRTLVDLRGSWILLIRGHSSQAATIAGSLWEHALACTILGGNPKRYTEFLKAQTGDLPWSPRELSKLAAAALETGSDSISGASAISERSRNIYASYKWLCKIKHPTVRASLHAAGAAKTSNGAYVVMAAPDLRPEDLPVKRMVLTICCGRTLEAIRVFVRALDCDASHPVYAEFMARFALTETALLALARTVRKVRLPFLLTPSEGAKL